MQNHSNFQKIIFVYLLAFLSCLTTFSQGNLVPEYVFQSDSSLKDKSSFFSSGNPYLFSQPDSIEKIREIIYYAKNNNLRIIVRGRGHSANGSSLPGNNEIVLFTDKFSNIEILSDSTAEIESGVVIENCKNFLYRRGFEMFVSNEGGPAPTLGGYISAGGIGSNDNTGFWETVISITMLNGKGEIVEINRNDTAFRWIFGSMGQLGFIIKAKIRIRKNNFLKTEIEEIDKMLIGKNKYYWYPIFFPAENGNYFEEKIKILAADIKEGCAVSDNSEVFYNTGGQKVKFDQFNPPLLYSDTGSVMMFGIKNLMSSEEPDLLGKVNCVRNKVDEFIKLNQAHPYFQVTYYNQSKEKLHEYLGPSIYNRFKEIKFLFDPYNIFGKNIF